MQKAVFAPSLQLCSVGFAHAKSIHQSPSHYLFRSRFLNLGLGAASGDTRLSSLRLFKCAILHLHNGNSLPRSICSVNDFSQSFSSHFLRLFTCTIVVNASHSNSIHMHRYSHSFPLVCGVNSIKSDLGSFKPISFIAFPFLLSCPSLLRIPPAKHCCFCKYSHLNYI